MKPVFLSAWIIAVSLTNGFAEKLGTIQAPPAGAKLRIFVEAITGEIDQGYWKTPHSKYRNWVYKSMQMFFADGTTYVIVPKKAVQKVIGKKERSLWKWKKSDWELAKMVGNRLYAEYAMFVEREFSRSTGHTFRFFLINIDSGKLFKKIMTIQRGFSNREEMSNMVRTAFEALNAEASEDLIATANRKGRAVSQELLETRKEILALMTDTEAKKAPAPPKKEQPVRTEKETPNQKKEPVVTAPAKPAETPRAFADKNVKVTQLEQRLAKLMETISQLEVMKKQFEDQKKKSALLARELAEREQREKALLNRLADSSKSPPVIVLTAPQDHAIVEFDFIHLTGVVEDEKGILRLEFFLNDRPLTTGPERGMAVIKRKSTKRLEFKQRIVLEKGHNRLKIRAVDSDGMFSEKTLSIRYEEKQKKMRAVIVGIDKYPHIRQLNYAVNDARIVYDHMVRHNRIPPENILLLLDQDATLRKIRSALGTELKNKAGKDDMVIIYFAGHGATERDTQSPDGDGLEKYLLPYDADLKDLYATALPMEELSRIFSRIQSERLIYIADACYSGASGGRTIGVTGTRASLSDAFMDRIAGGKGRVIITASRANEVSAENEKLQHGVFTYYLIEGLKGPADVDKDGLVSVDEAYDYVSEHVPKATNQEQHPVKKGSVEGQLIISVVE